MMNRRIADISSSLQCAVKGMHADTWIALLCIISLLVITVLPVSTDRSESEVYLCFLIPTILLVGFLTILIRKLPFIFNWIDGIVLGWYAFAMGRFWLDASYPVPGFALRTTLMCMLYFAVRIQLAGCRISGKYLSLLLIIFSIVEAWMGYSQLISGGSRHHLYPVTGSFLNPGPYSAYLTLGIVLTLTMKKMRDYRWLIVMFLGIPLMLTMSRATFLALFICVIVLYRDRINGWRQWGLLILFAVMCGVALYGLKSGSADGRGMINYIGVQCFFDSPLRGNGIGSFFHIFAAKTAEISMQYPAKDLSSVDVIDYAFNDVLLVGVEQGAVGVAFATALIVTVMHSLWRGSMPLFLAALSLLIVALFSYPFELLPYQIIAVIITAYASSIRKPESTSAHSRIKAIFCAIFVLSPICWISRICRSEIRQRLTAEKEYRMLAGLHDSAFIKDYYALYHLLCDNKHFLFDFAKILSQQGRYNDSNDMLRRGALISNDPMFLMLQGNNYRDMEAYDLAEKAYLQAWHTMPNRIYPLYRLMKLHEQIGDKEQALSYAHKVIDFEEKIKSPAVNDLKREAKELIEHER